ncbi:MAG: deoxyribodipyrimidine photo-lyase [Candidatus Magasanikbacteria bacterium]
MLPNRSRQLNNFEYKKGAIVYWMSRDMRVHDNWALLYALKAGQKNEAPVAVVFNLVPTFLGATLRQYDFMLKGLQTLETELKKYNIPFFLTWGKAEEEIPKFVKKNKVGIIVSDFSPLKINRNWKNSIIKNIEIPFLEVDAHNIVPCFVASNKQEYGAYTLRPKINKILKDYLTEFPKVVIQKINFPTKAKKINWKNVYKKIEVDKNVKPIDWLSSGENFAKQQLKSFIKNSLNQYHLDKNDPNKNAVSNLSPYLHFGQISAQRIALEINKSEASKTAKETFLEELIVRRELSDNYCFYNPNYDSLKGAPNWALTTLQEHSQDKREYLYSKKQFEEAKTHDDLWNSAQKEMVTTGKMHGYMRMYWAKKILEWSKSAKEAFKIAIYLNDKYELDGRDPNGYVGVAWSIAGVHDRAWFEREVFGKIRYMNYNGCKNKFDVNSYIKKFI